jgi:hypothetical protein
MATDLIKWKRHQHQHQQSERTAQWSNGVHLSSRYQNGHRSTDDGEPNFYYLKAEYEKHSHLICVYEKHSHLICVSDGSVITHDMSFWWILATPQGTRLIGSKGPCNGRGNSLRAEGAGMLSGTLFLSILSEYFDQSFKIVFISDNA